MTANSPLNFVSANGIGAILDANLNAAVQGAATAGTARSFVGISGMSIMLQGITAPGDGSAGLFYWSAGSYTDDNSNVLVPPAAAGQGAWLRSEANSRALSVANIAALRALTTITRTESSVIVLGYTTQADGGAGIYWFNASDTTSADNGGTIIVDASSRRWYLEHNGVVSIKQFGATLNGTTVDATAISNAISAAITQKFQIWAPAGVANLSTSTLIFPHTMPEGFSFQSHPDFTLSYTGTGDVVLIDSCYHVNIKLGRIIGTAGAASGIHVKPAAVGANGQTVCVTSQISFVFIGGVLNGLYLDCSVGSIAQTNFYGIEIANGFGLTGVITGFPNGVIVTGVNTAVFQGNIVNINYIQPAPSGFGVGAVWVGITDGGSTFGPTENNVNQYIFGAIDGAGYANSFGVDTSAGFNAFTGPIVDVQTGVQLESGAKNISLITADINVNAGGKRINNLSTVQGSVALLGGQGFTVSGTQQTGGVTTLPNGTLIQSGSVVLSVSPTTFSFPTAFATTPCCFGGQSNNGAGAAVDVVALSATQYIVHGPLTTGISWIAIGPGNPPI